MRYSRKLQTTVKLMFNVFGCKDEDKLEAYMVLLSDEDHEKVCKRISRLIKTWKPAHSGHIPAMSDIINEEIGIEEVQEAWEKFNKFCFERYKPMPDMIYTIKKMIGIQKVNTCKSSDWKWIEKEFKELYPKWKAGQLEVMSDPKVKHLKQLSSGNYYLPSGKKVVNGHVTEKKVNATPYFEKMREILKNAGAKDAKA